jgi:cytidylate kinase
MVVTLSRQLGAGGSQVAEAVAQALGYRLVDRALAESVAARAGVSAEEVARLEERTPGFFERFLHASVAELPDAFVPPSGALDDFEEARLVRATRALVRELAAAGRVVIVGRGAFAILAGDPAALHVRVVAPLAQRVARLAERLGSDPRAAQQLIARSDAERARYFTEYYALDVDDPTHFDLVVNTARLGIPGAAALIAARVRACESEGGDGA